MEGMTLDDSLDTTFLSYYELTTQSRIVLEREMRYGDFGTQRFEIVWQEGAERWRVTYRPHDVLWGSSYVQTMLKTEHLGSAPVLKFPMLNRIKARDVQTDIVLGVIADYKNISKKKWYSTCVRLLDESTTDTPVQVNIFAMEEILVPYVLQVGQIIVVSGVAQENYQIACHFKTTQGRFLFQLIDADEYLDEGEYSSQPGGYVLYTRLRQLQQYSKALVADIPAHNCLLFSLKRIEQLYSDPKDLDKLDLIARIKDFSLDDNILTLRLEDGTGQCVMSAVATLSIIAYLIRHMQAGVTYVKFRDLSVKLTRAENLAFTIIVDAKSSVALLPADHISARQIQERFLQRSIGRNDGYYEEENTYTAKSATEIVFNALLNQNGRCESTEAHTEELRNLPFKSIKQLLRVNSSTNRCLLRGRFLRFTPIEKSMPIVCMQCRKQRKSLVACECGEQARIHEFVLQFLFEDEFMSQMPVALVSRDAEFLFDTLPYENRVVRRILSKSVTNLESARMCEIYVERGETGQWYCTHTRIKR